MACSNHQLDSKTQTSTSAQLDVELAAENKTIAQILIAKAVKQTRVCIELGAVEGVVAGQQVVVNIGVQEVAGTRRGC